MATEDVGDTLARPLEAAHVADLRVRRLAHAPREAGGHEHDEAAQEEERVEAPAPHQPFREQRRERGRGEAGHAIDAEGHPAPRRFDQVDDVREVRDEERGEAEPLQQAHDDQQRHRVRDGGDDRREQHAGDPREHERPAPDRVDPRAEQRLRHDPDGAVDVHHEADLELAAAEPLHVEREQHEAVLAEEEEKTRERRADERGVR